MENKKVMIEWARIGLSVLLAYLIFAILIPNMGKIVIDRSTQPPTSHVTQLPQQIAVLSAIVLPALAGIIMGARYSRFKWMEPIGWGVLIILFIISTFE
jgi:hypothetical protein